MWDVIYCILHYKKNIRKKSQIHQKKCYFCDARIQLWSGAIPECYTHIHRLQRPFLIVLIFRCTLRHAPKTPARTITLICQLSWQVHCTHITLEGCSSGPKLGPWRPSSSSAASTLSSATS